MSANVLSCDLSDPLINQIKHFASVIRKNALPLVSGREGLRTLAAIEAIQIAAKTGRKIQLADISGHQELDELSKDTEGIKTTEPNLTNLAL